MYQYDMFTKDTRNARSRAGYTDYLQSGNVKHLRRNVTEVTVTKEDKDNILKSALKWAANELHYRDVTPIVLIKNFNISPYNAGQILRTLTATAL